MTYWLSIGLLLLAGTGAALRFAADASWLHAAATGYPVVLLVAVVLLAWRFERSRLAWAAVLVGATWLTLALLPAERWPRVIAPMCVLVPLALGVLAVDEDRPLWSTGGLTQLVLLLGATSVAVALIAAPIPSFENAFAALRVRPSDATFIAASGVALVAFTLSALVIGALLARRRRPTEAALLLLLPALLFMLAAPDEGPARGAWALAAGGLLVFGVVESAVALAYLDELTGLPSRRALGTALRQLRPPFAIAVADIDLFKSVNDTYGHDTGDQVLRMVASHLATVRDGRAYRSGGEEFTIVFPGMDTVEAYHRVEEVRVEIEESGFRLRSSDRPKKEASGARRRGSETETGRDVRTLEVTLSAGVADARDGQNDPEATISAADRALYAAKRNGRNRTIAAGKRRIPAA